MRKYVPFILIIATLFLSSCGGKGDAMFGTKHGKHTVTIAGSTSVMPFVEKLAEHYMVDHPNYVIDVQGGGSTAGIQACMNNTVQIGMSSRELRAEEMVLREIPICYDGISIIVHPDNPINGLSFKQVSDIFSGKIKNWKELGWVDRNIDAITREEGSGTRGSFEDLVMKSDDIDDSTMVQDSNGSVREVVATDPYAIGYISLGLVDKRVKPLPIDGIVPSVGNIKRRKYMLVRPFLFLLNGEPKEDVRKFVDFILSKDGQKILEKEGLINVNG